jgi:hypothetical protein
VLRAVLRALLRALLRAVLQVALAQWPLGLTLLLSREYLLCSVVMTFSMYSISLRLVSTQEPEEQCHQGRFHSCRRRHRHSRRSTNSRRSKDKAEAAKRQQRQRQGLECVNR